MDFLKQLAMLLRMNLLGVPQRLGLACTTVIGVTCAVGVLVSMLAMGVGAFVGSMLWSPQSRVVAGGHPCVRSSVPLPLLRPRTVDRRRARVQQATSVLRRRRL